MRTLILCGLLAVAQNAQAEIYKCRINGATVYQSDPCVDGARLAVKASRPPATNGARPSELAQPAAISKPTPSQMERDTALTNALVRERETRGLDRQIAEIEAHIVYLRENMGGELGSLREKKTRSKNNLAGATWEQSISEEMLAVTSRYQLEIQAEQNRLATLRAQRTALNP